MRTLLLLATFTLCVASLSFCDAYERSGSAQVVYLLEVVVFERRDSHNLDLDFASLRFESDAASLFEIGYDPITMQLLAGTPFGTLYFQTVQEKLREFESYSSWFTTVHGKPARVLISRERISAMPELRMADGIELELLPLSVTSSEILTSVRLASLVGTLAIETQVLLKEGVPQPVAVFRKNRKDERGFLKIFAASQEKYVVLYVSAFHMGDQKEDLIASASGLEGLLERLWPEEGRESVSEISASVSYGKALTADIGLDVWLGNSIRASAAYRGIVTPRLEYSIGVYPAKWSLRLDAMVYYVLGSKGVLALGFVDESIILPNLTIGASLYPLVVDFQTGRSSSQYFSCFIRYSPGFLDLCLSYIWCSHFKELELSVGVRPLRWMVVSLGYQTDLLDVHRLFINASVNFR